MKKIRRQKLKKNRKAILKRQRNQFFVEGGDRVRNSVPNDRKQHYFKIRLFKVHFVSIIHISHLILTIVM